MSSNTPSNNEKMTEDDTVSRKLDLRKLEYSPHENPLLTPTTVEIRRRKVRSGRGQDLVDPSTGEVKAVSTIQTIEERDDQEFVKVFAEGVKAAYGLTRTGARVFQAVLEEYQNTPMTGGFADSVYLCFIDDGLSGRSLGMSEKTFQRGLRELLLNGFLAPRSPNLFWVNPALFFKGDRVRFVKEYVRKRSIKDQTKDSDV